MPNAKKNMIQEQKSLSWESIYKVRLKAKPVNNEGNEALISFLSEHFETLKKNITIMQWKTSKLKVVKVLQIRNHAC
jgi:uncharacterized protein YggU (UPF0235/DUF167 family)